jgi:hypothetical protein
MDSAAIVCSSSPFHLSVDLNNGSTVLYSVVDLEPAGSETFSRDLIRIGKESFRIWTASDPK